MNYHLKDVQAIVFEKIEMTPHQFANLIKPIFKINIAYIPENLKCIHLEKFELFGDNKEEKLYIKAERLDMSENVRAIDIKAISALATQILIPVLYDKKPRP
jgi:hypothetical protein